jgi:hypothetical protein
MTSGIARCDRAVHGEAKDARKIDRAAANLYRRRAASHCIVNGITDLIVFAAPIAVAGTPKPKHSGSACFDSQRFLPDNGNPAGWCR